MHILLTDLLACPRCGAEHGLIVLADRLESRRVMDGRLGCANCREEYPVRGGIADLRHGPALEGALAPADAERALRTAALLGVGEGRGAVLLLGAGEALAAEVARLLPEARVIAAAGAAAEPAGGVDRVLVSASLPFRARALQGVAVLGGAGGTELAELTRPLAPGARLVLDPAPGGAASELARHGLSVLLDQEGVVVASAS